MAPYDWEHDAIPIANMIGNLTVDPLPDGVVPLDAIILVRIMDKDGTLGWTMRWTRGMRDPIERIGPLIGFSDSDRAEVSDRLNGYDLEDDE